MLEKKYEPGKRSLDSPKALGLETSGLQNDEAKRRPQNIGKEADFIEHLNDKCHVDILMVNLVCH